MPLQATSGAASYDAFGGGAATAANYIEDVFSTWLYTSTSGTDNQIINGIDLAGEGGMVWVKSRSTGSTNNYVLDTVRGSSLGNTRALVTNSTAAQSSGSFLDYMTFNSNGFTAKAVSGGGELGTNTYYGDFASWTFREQPKFFDVVTYTGTGSARTVAHNLGSEPGFIIIKRTDGADEWFCYHRSIGAGSVIYLNLTNASNSAPNMWNNTAPTSTVFTLGTDSGVNGSGRTYVAYLFAHDAGGFGLTGTDNVISCGSFTTDGSGNATVNLGYEPQWILIKRTGTGAWNLYDTMRGWGRLTDQILRPNTSDAEIAANTGSGEGWFTPTATGFSSSTANILNASDTYIYIAIRRGPMKTPTTGTSVFEPVAYSGNSVTDRLISVGFPADATFAFRRNQSESKRLFDRLRGNDAILQTNDTGAEYTLANRYVNFNSMQNSVAIGSDSGLNASGSTYVIEAFRRAPGFFDEVCYTGTGSATTVTHNLTVVPEMMIVKRRSGVADWPVYSSAVGNTKFLLLNSTGDTITDNVWNNTTPTATEFSVRDQNTVNASGSTYVAYLFATVAGVSKVGSYTGTGTTQVIDCGFTSGARFVLIKRSSGTGDWYVWDSARGIVAGNDPYLLLNSTAAEVTNTDFVDTAATGFEISSTAPAAINANGGTFIFLAIA